jgi:hypothetical protein
VSSPPASPALRSAARAEWKDLSAERLQASLVRDFAEPDHEWRGIGAIVRLGYYFPAAAKPLLDAELAKPVYDDDQVRAHVRSLYVSTNRTRDLRAFVATHGEPARDGALRMLFEDLSTQIAYEEKRVTPATTGGDVRARECLVELFGYPKTVREADKPYPKYSSMYERERLVAATRAR